MHRLDTGSSKGDDTLCQILGMVADAFQLDGDPQGRQYLAQINRPWLPQCQYPDHQIVNLDASCDWLPAPFG